MSKHRRRSDERRNEQPINNLNPYGMNPQQQIMDLIGNIGNGDMSQIANLLSSLNGDGVNFNNLNMNSMDNGSNMGNGIGNPNGNNPINQLGNNMGNPLGMNPNMAPQDFNPLQILLSGLAGGGMPFPNIGSNIGSNKSSNKKSGSNNRPKEERKIKDEEDIKEENNTMEFKEESLEKNSNDNLKKIEINEDDDIIKMLKSIKVLVEPNKVKFIDRIIELYLVGEFNDVI